MRAEQIWQAVLGDLQVRVSKNAFENWLRHTRIVGFRDDDGGAVATVAAANAFSVATLQARYGTQIEQAMGDIVGRPIRVQFTVASATDDEGATDDGEGVGPATSERPAGPVAGDGGALFPPSAAAASARPRTTGGAPSRPRPRVEATDHPGQATAPARRGTQQLALTATPTHGLNPRYVYESYVVGSSNRFAHAASLSVAERPGGKFNPFYVYGGVGLGKTHLLHAIGHRALELRPDLTIVYVSSETFTNGLINALRAKADMEEFRSRYRAVDILMIDDIQFIAGKESTQEEFFHTFNALHQSGKQVIITSDKPPKAIAGLEERLRSRFEGGLSADVQLPDYEMRTAILRSKGEELGVPVPSDVIEYVAQRGDGSNTRELEGALNKILALAEITDRSPTMALAMEALTDTGGGGRRVKASPGDVVDAVAAHFGVAHKDLRGRGRTKEIVRPRQVAMYLIRESTDASLVDIGQALGGRDHTTVMHGIGKVERELATDTALRGQVMAIREALFAGA